MVSFSFVNPVYLFFLLIIPGMIFIHFFSLKSSKSVALKFANFPAIARIKGVDFFSKNIVVTVLSILISLLLVFSLAGMTLHTVIDASAYSFVIALDTSQSMEADDIDPSRMEAAKASALDFIDTVPIGTEIGLISFSGNSLIEQHVTGSKTLVKTAIRDVAVSDISGTDLQEAVITGTNLLTGRDSKALILLSDGQTNVGDLIQAVEYANNNEVIIHTIAVGTREGGQTSFGLSKLDEDSLKSLAFNTDGQFFSVGPDEIDVSQSGIEFKPDRESYLEFLNEALDKTRRKVGIDLSVYLLMGSIVLFALEFFLVSTHYKRLI